MPSIPLHRRLLNELDDHDRSFKRARLQWYLEDSSVELAPDPESDHDSDADSISDLSSISSLSSLSSDHSAASHLSLSHSEIEEIFYSNSQADLDRL
jgi:hypothetical protein